MFISLSNMSFASKVTYFKTTVAVWSKTKLFNPSLDMLRQSKLFYPGSGHNVKKVRLKQQLFIFIKYDFKCDMLMISVPGGLC